MWTGTRFRRSHVPRLSAGRQRGVLCPVRGGKSRIVNVLSGGYNNSKDWVSDWKGLNDIGELPGLSSARLQTPLREVWKRKGSCVVRAAPEKEEQKQAGASKEEAGGDGSSPSDGGKGPMCEEVDKKPRYKIEKKTSWAGVLGDKILDSADDVFMHIRRGLKGLPTSSALRKFVKRGDTMVIETEKPVVLVLGSGWGAHSLLKVVDTEKYDVICVSPSNAFLFTPMLPGSAVGTVEFRSLLEPVRLANQFVSYFEAYCESIDPVGKVAKCVSAIEDQGAGKEMKQRKFEIPYDVMVVAVGEKPASFGVPGVEDYTYYLKTTRDAVKLRKRIQEVFELASLPGTSEEDIQRLLTFIVVGGGPTGVEFTGTMSDFLREDLKRKYPELSKYVKIKLIQSGPTILNQFDPRLAKIATENLKRLGVEILLETRVTEVQDSYIVLNKNEKVYYGVCVWSAGNAPNPLIQDLANEIPQQVEFAKGRAPRKLHVDQFLRVIGAQDLIALGDCSMIEDAPLPPTAQVAGQQGAYVAHVINRGYKLGVGGLDMVPPYKEAKDLSLADKVFSTLMDSMDDSMDESMEKRIVLKKPFEFLNLGIMASVGDDKAVAQVEAFDNKLDVWGSPAYLLWRSVYITKQVSLRNRVLILFDWLKAKVFGRDLSQF